jgi:ribosomal protein L21E
MKISFLFFLQMLLCASIVSAQGDDPQKAPKVQSINRRSPLEPITSASSVKFRVIFTEEVVGVKPTVFELKKVSGTVKGDIEKVSGNGATYDITISSLKGHGVFRLDLVKPNEIHNHDGKKLAAAFKKGETYTLIDLSIPALTSVTIASNNPLHSFAKPGDIITITFTASIPVKTPSVTIAGKTAAVSPAGGNSYRAAYIMQAEDASGVVPFTIHFKSTGGVAGVAVKNTTDGSKVIFDKKAPTVSAINRQSPLADALSATTSVTFRITFNEKVTGADRSDFLFRATSGFVTGTVGANALVAVGTTGTTYDLIVSSLSGSGSFRLDLKSSGTGIADAAGNAITTGFTGGQHYTLTSMQIIPALTSVSIASGNPAPSLAKPGDVITIKFTTSLPVNTPSVSIAGKTATVSPAGGNTYHAAYTMQTADASGVVPFTIDFKSTGGVAGVAVKTTTDGSKVTFDKTVPVVSAINRQSPLTEVISEATAVTFRITFSEKITGADRADFVFHATSGSVTGTIGSNAVVPVGTAGTTYDLQISSITGSGSFRLDLNSNGTGVADAAGNAITSGFTGGQHYTLPATQPPLQPGFKTIIPLAPVNMLTQDTKDKPQAKTWTYDGKWWAVLSVEGGTKLYRLDGKSWTEQLTVITGKSRPDCWVVGDLVHLLLYKGALNNTVLYTLQYDVTGSTYKLWNTRPGGTVIVFPEGSQTATLIADNRGRIWTASDGLTEIKLWYSDAPYTTWSAPITIASNVKDDDICTLVAMPSLGKIGIFWSNQNTKKFGFKVHNGGTDPLAWSGDEIPAAASALDNIGRGMADNHMCAKVGTDGTVYMAAKTSYDTAGHQKLVLLIRRSAGVWDSCYTVTMFSEGTQPCLLLNEIKKKLKVVYTTVENGGDILYRESSTDNISFSQPLPLIGDPGIQYNYATSTHQNYTSTVVIFATNVTALPNQAVSVIASDDELVIDNDTGPLAALGTDNAISLGAWPNPTSGPVTVRFMLPAASSFNLELYDSRGTKIKTIQNGWAPAGLTNTVSLDGIHLQRGSYLVRIQAGNESKTIQIIVQ